MPTPTLRPYGVCALVVGVLMTLLAVGPSDAARPGRPRVTLAASATTVEIGKRVTLSGVVRNAKAGQKVTLQHRAKGRWVRVATKRPTARVTFQVRPRALGVAAYRLVLAKKVTTPTAVSRVVKVKVRPARVAPKPDPEDEQPPVDSDPPPDPPPDPAPGPPTMTGFAPTSGDVTGGDQLTVTGTDLAAVDEVRLGEIAAELVSATATAVVARTPAHAAGPVTVELLVDGTVVATSTTSYEYVVPVLESVDEFTPAAETIVLQPEAVATVVELPSGGGYELALAAPDDRFVPGTRIYLRPGHRDAWSGLMAEVDEVVAAQDAGSGPTLVLHQVAADQVLDTWELQQTVTVGALPGGPSTAAGARGGRVLGPAATARALSTAGAATTRLANFNRSFLDCRKKVEDEEGNVTWESVPTGGPEFQVNFAIDDLQVNVKDHKRGSQQYFEASLTGKPRLDIVGKVEYAARCDLLPQVTDRFKLTLQTPSGIELEIKPDISVSFSAAGKFVVTKQFKFYHGISKLGDGPVKPTNQITAQPATAETSLTAEVSIRAGLDASVTYRGFVGLGIEGGPKVSLEATYDVDANTTCVMLGFSLEAQVYAELDALFFHWKQPLLDPFELPIVDEEWCTENPQDPNTDVVLDPELAEYSANSYVTTPTTWGDSPFPPGTFEPLNYGDAYMLRTDLTLEPGNYYFHRPLYIPEGVTLTVSEGTHIKAGHCYWTIHLQSQPCINVTGGSLLMKGTQEDPIIVTRYADDSVDGDTDGVTPERSMAGVRPFAMSDGLVKVTEVQFRNSTGLTLSGSGTLTVERSTFRSGSTLGAQAWAGAVRVTGSVVDETSSATLYSDSVTVERSRFASGVAVGSSTTGRFAGNTVTNGPLNVSGATAVVGNHFIDTEAEVSTSAATKLESLSGNTTDDGEPLTVQLTGGQVVGATTWRSATYVVSGAVAIPEGATLDFEDAVVKLGWCGSGYYSLGSCVSVQGGIGFHDSVLTGLNDATVGGDALVNTAWLSAFTPVLSETSELTVSGTEVRHLVGQWVLPYGSTATISNALWDINGSAVLRSSSDLSIVDSEFSHPAPDSLGSRPLALHVTGGSASVSRSTFSHVVLNTGVPITLKASNMAYATLQFSATDQALDASGNWWGTPAGPALSGPDQQVFGSVTVAPWCAVPACS